MLEREERIVVGKEVCFCDAEFEIEDVEEFTLDASDVALAEDSCAQRPVDVLERGVVQVLRGWGKRGEPYGG